MSTRRQFCKEAAIASAIAAISLQMDDGVAAEGVTGATPLKTHRISQTDLVVSRIAYGTAMLSMDQRSSEFIPKTMQAIRTAIDNGITFFDFADVYGLGQSEVAMGEVLRQVPGLRDKVVIQSKCGARLPNGVVVGEAEVDFDLSRKQIVTAVEGTLKRLGVDYLDILLLHGPDPLGQPEEVAHAFHDLSGKVRYFGVSNFKVTHIELLKRYVQQPLVTNQIWLSLANYHPIIGWDCDCGGLVDYCRTHDMQVQAYSPLNMTWAADANLNKKQLSEMLTQIARQHGVSWAAIMISWLLSHPAGIVPVIGASNPNHIIDNCVADRIRLSREEWIGLLRTAAPVA